MPEINEIAAKLAKSSKRAALFSFVGIAIVVATLVFSIYSLRKLDIEIGAKKQQIGQLDAEIAQKTKVIKENQNTLADTIQNFAEKASPEVVNDVIAKTVEKNPQANEIILTAVSKNSPASASPPANARVGFSTGNNVVIRENPDLEAKKVGSLEKGQTIYIKGFSENTTKWKGQDGRWANIQTQSGVEGYVFEPLTALK
jgi:hypothetical protein